MLLSNRWRGSTSSVRATQATFQIENWPSPLSTRAIVPIRNASGYVNAAVSSVVPRTTSPNSPVPRAPARATPGGCRSIPSIMQLWRRTYCCRSYTLAARGSYAFGYIHGVLAALAILFFCSGISALIYQVLWMRLLGLTFGVTIYAAATVSASFMAGLAAG